MNDHVADLPLHVTRWLERPRLPILVLDTESAGYPLCHANRAMADLTARPLSACLNRPVAVVLGLVDSSELERTLPLVLAHDRPLTLTLECRRPDGSTFWGELWLAAVETARGHPAILGLMRDISLQRLDQARLERRATNDPLTGLHNRSHFLEALRRLLPTLSVTGTGVAVLFIDLDNFKPINDRFGHAVGDAVLVALSQRLGAGLRATDLAARFGGDEFVAAFTGLCSLDQGRKLAERLFTSLRQPLWLEPGVEYHPGASLGLAFTRDAQLTPEALVEAADLAMYQAKHSGKNRLTVAKPQDQSGVTRRHSPFLAALRQGDLHLRFLPVINLARGDTVGFEALPHWQHPELGLLGSEHFAHLADAPGTGETFHRWLIHQSARLAARLKRAGYRLGIGFNMPRDQIETSAFLETLRNARSLFDDGRLDLTLEIVESIQFDDLTLACKVLEEARGLGVQVVLDDFGSGVSSVTYANRLPLDIIKMDPEVVRHIDQRLESQRVATGIIAMAHATGRRVAAGGVTRPEELAVLKRLQCDFAQGPVFAAPMPIDTLERTYLDPARPPRYPLRRGDGQG